MQNNTFISQQNFISRITLNFFNPRFNAQFIATSFKRKWDREVILTGILALIWLSRLFIENLEYEYYIHISVMVGLCVLGLVFRKIVSITIALMMLASAFKSIEVLSSANPQNRTHTFLSDNNLFNFGSTLSRRSKKKILYLINMYIVEFRIQQEFALVVSLSGQNFVLDAFAVAISQCIVAVKMSYSEMEEGNEMAIVMNVLFFIVLLVFKYLDHSTERLAFFNSRKNELFGSLLNGSVSNAVLVSSYDYITNTLSGTMMNNSAKNWETNHGIPGNSGDRQFGFNDFVRRVRLDVGKSKFTSTSLEPGVTTLREFLLKRHYFLLQQAANDPNGIVPAFNKKGGVVGGDLKLKEVVVDELRGTYTISLPPAGISGLSNTGAEQQQQEQYKFTKKVIHVMVKLRAYEMDPNLLSIQIEDVTAEKEAALLRKQSSEKDKIKLNGLNEIREKISNLLSSKALRKPNSQTTTNVNILNNQQLQKQQSTPQAGVNNPNNNNLGSARGGMLPMRSRGESHMDAYFFSEMLQRAAAQSQQQQGEEGGAGNNLTIAAQHNNNNNINNSNDDDLKSINKQMPQQTQQLPSIQQQQQQYYLNLQGYQDVDTSSNNDAEEQQYNKLSQRRISQVKPQNQLQSFGPRMHSTSIDRFSAAGQLVSSPLGTSQMTNRLRFRDINHLQPPPTFSGGAAGAGAPLASQQFQNGIHVQLSPPSNNNNNTSNLHHHHHIQQQQQQSTHQPNAMHFHKASTDQLDFGSNEIMSEYKSTQQRPSLSSFNNIDFEDNKGNVTLQHQYQQQQQQQQPQQQYLNAIEDMRSIKLGLTCVLNNCYTLMDFMLLQMGIGVGNHVDIRQIPVRAKYVTLKSIEGVLRELFDSVNVIYVNEEDANAGLVTDVRRLKYALVSVVSAVLQQAKDKAKKEEAAGVAMPLISDFPSSLNEGDEKRQLHPQSSSCSVSVEVIIERIELAAGFDSIRFSVIAVTNPESAKMQSNSNSNAVRVSDREDYIALSMQDALCDERVLAKMLEKAGFCTNATNEKIVRAIECRNIVQNILRIGVAMPKYVLDPPSFGFAVYTNIESVDRVRRESSAVRRDSRNTIGFSFRQNNNNNNLNNTSFGGGMQQTMMTGTNQGVGAGSTATHNGIVHQMASLNSNSSTNNNNNNNNNNGNTPNYFVKQLISVKKYSRFSNSQRDKLGSFTQRERIASLNSNTIELELTQHDLKSATEEVVAGCGVAQAGDTVPTAGILPTMLVTTTMHNHEEILGMEADDAAGMARGGIVTAVNQTRDSSRKQYTKRFEESDSLFPQQSLAEFMQESCTPPLPMFHNRIVSRE